MKKGQIFLAFLPVLLSLLFSSCEYLLQPESNLVNEICVIKADGSEMKTVLTDPQTEMFVASNDKIYYSSSKEGYKKLYSINLDGSGDTMLWDKDSSLYPLSISRDGKKLFWGSYKGLYMMDLTSGNVTQMSIRKDNNGMYPPRFSKDMSKIVYSRGEKLETMDISGSYEQNVLKNDASKYLYAPNFIFNDSKIIYMEKEAYSNAPAYLRIYSVAENTDSILLSKEKAPFIYHELYVLNDSKILCNMGTSLDNDTIKVIDPANNFRTVSLDAGTYFWPSGDGSRILYKKNDDLYVINPDGSGKRLLRSRAEGEYYLLTPAISPDGKYIVFARIYNSAN
jgi:tricorn protease-like protein